MEPTGCYKTVPIYTKLHGITTQKTVILMFIAGVTANRTQYCGKFCRKRRLPSGLVNVQCILSVASDKVFDLDLLVQIEHYRVSCV